MAVQVYRIHLVAQIDGKLTFEEREDLNSRYHRGVYKEHEYGIFLISRTRQVGGGVVFIPWTNITHIEMFKEEMPK